MERIKKLSQIIVVAIGITFGLTALAAAYFVISPATAVDYFSDPSFALPPVQTLEAWQYVSLASLIALNALPVLYVLWQFLRLFKRFSEGAVFAKSTTRHIFNAAKGLFVCVIIAIFNTSAAVLIITANAPSGGRVLVFSLSLSDAVLILAGLILMAMSWVMQEAAHLSDENAGFI